MWTTMVGLRSREAMQEGLLRDLLGHAERGSRDRQRQLEAPIGYFLVALLIRMASLYCKKVIRASEEAC